MEASSDHIIVSFLVSVLLDKLSSEALRDFGSVWCVESELCALSDVLRFIHELLEFAEQAQTKNILVKRCLRNLRNVSYRAQDILDEFIYEALKEKDERYGGKKVPFFSFNLYAEGILRKQEIIPLINNELIKKLVEIEKELKDHYLRDSGIQKSHGVNDEIDTRPKSGSLFDESVTLGRKKEQDEIRERLLSNPDDENQKQVSVVAIVGLGGVGKTTLAQLVYNDPDVEKNFETRAWVCVSTDFNVLRLTSEILESLTGTSPNLSNLEPLQRKLRLELKGKRFLIVLDDVWTEKGNDWKALRVAFMAAGEGSRIIVTTRSRRVSSIMHPIYTHDLQILSDEECWSIMEKRISMDYGPIPSNLEKVGRKIAKKCKGLPLAASTLAGLVCSSSSDLNHWQQVLNSSLWDLEESNLPAALSLSYYFLPTYLKQCFAYCSVFPKDYKFHKQSLIKLWMAEGFISSSTTRMEVKGSQYFDDLVHRSFFQRYNEENVRFVMHDLIHDLAQTVSGEVCCRLKYGESYCSYKETRYLSICCVKHLFDNDKNHGNKRLSTLIILNQGYSCRTIESFGGLRYLRVLDLCGSNISRLPTDIGDLKYLHYINLSYLSGIKRLPESLCDLNNLQSLILHDSGVTQLPRGMKYLRNLQHLDLNGCPIFSMPRGIGRLTSLKTLTYFPVSEDDEGFGLKELKELSQLEGTLSIHFSESVIEPLDALEAHMMNKLKIDELVLTWPWKCLLHSNSSSYTNAVVFEGLRPHTELKSLHINCYGGLIFPSWFLVGLPSFDKLVSLTLNHCIFCKVLPPIGELPLLESLCLSYMLELEEWPSSSRGEDTEFPSLRRLTIESCPALRALPQPLLSSPRLQELITNACPKLRMLPYQGLSKLISLKNLHIGELMEGLVQSLNEIDSLPPNINRLSFRNCTSLPKGLRNLSSLQHLKFGRHSEVRYSPEELPSNVTVTRDL